ncbi:hypothetical protein RsoM2USA_283 [Ralstonia phage RsoM2USA]|nr:hypothetical protein RsoM2USA_283 [Ralstonia phage RsoM2USA]
MRLTEIREDESEEIFDWFMDHCRKGQVSKDPLDENEIRLILRRIQNLSDLDYTNLTLVGNTAGKELFDMPVPIPTLRELTLQKFRIQDFSYLPSVEDLIMRNCDCGPAVYEYLKNKVSNSARLNNVPMRMHEVLELVDTGMLEYFWTLNDIIFQVKKGADGYIRIWRNQHGAASQQTQVTDIFDAQEYILGLNLPSEVFLDA